MSKKRIMLVEDNPADRGLFEVFLSDTEFFDYEVIPITLAKDAINLLEKETFEILFLDLSLPDSNGLDTLDLLRPFQASLPIIVLTGYDDKDYAVKAINSGAQDYLVKGDYDGQVLEKSIKYSIERQRVIRQRQKAESAFHKGEEGERQRVARDIHDGIGQMLIGIKYRVANMDRDTLEGLSEELDYIEDLLEKTIDEARRISENITPRVLKDLGLKSAIEQLCSHVGQLRKIEFQLNLAKNLKFNDKAMVPAIYRIVQEALNNIVKYAEAKTVHITLEVVRKQINLIIEDDGIGFDAVNGRRGNGLRNMAERSGVLNGSFDLISKKGKGTKISISIPLIIV